MVLSQRRGMAGNIKTSSGCQALKLFSAPSYLWSSWLKNVQNAEPQERAGTHKETQVLTALMAPVAALKRFTSCAESTDRPLLMDTELTPSPPEFGSMSESGLKNTQTHQIVLRDSQERCKELSER